jgi:hypothetical protein
MSLRAALLRTPPRNDNIEESNMGLLEGKNALIFGLANERSIAWGITQAFKREGANLGISYAGEVLERRVNRWPPKWIVNGSKNVT